MVPSIDQIELIVSPYPIALRRLTEEKLQIVVACQLDDFSGHRLILLVSPEGSA